MKAIAFTQTRSEMLALSDLRGCGRASAMPGPEAEPAIEGARRQQKISTKPRG